jgi:hypothetical protein
VLVPTSQAREEGFGRRLGEPDREDPHEELPVVGAQALT